MTATQHGGPITLSENEAETLNPFLATRRAAPVAHDEADSQRAIAEVQAAMMIAQRFPRDQVLAMDNILQAFTRPSLAETAMYSYARGGTDITGPSIRAAETIAQSWGNIQFGVRELEQRNGESKVEAFAWDVQTNTRSVKTFAVPHFRDTKKGKIRLEDSRDIYEHVANQGARRLRACILSVIPGDVIEGAMKQAETTLKTKVQITPELIQSLLDKFASIGVGKEAIEKRIQRRVDAITPALVVQLGKIYNSVTDGMSTAGEWFDAVTVVDTTEPKPPASKTDALAEKLKAQQQAGQSAAVDGQAPADNAAPQAAKAPIVDSKIDEKAEARDRRKTITDAWKGYEGMRGALQQLYAKSALTDLTLEQLDDFLARTPDLLGGMQ